MLGTAAGASLTRLLAPAPRTTWQRWSLPLYFVVAVIAVAGVTYAVVLLRRRWCTRGPNIHARLRNQPSFQRLRTSRGYEPTMASIPVRPQVGGGAQVSHTFLDSLVCYPQEVDSPTVSEHTPVAVDQADKDLSEDDGRRLVELTNL